MLLRGVDIWISLRYLQAGFTASDGLLKLVMALSCVLRKCETRNAWIWNSNGSFGIIDLFLGRANLFIFMGLLVQTTDTICHYFLSDNEQTIRQSSRVIGTIGKGRINIKLVACPRVSRFGRHFLCIVDVSHNTLTCAGATTDQYAQKWHIVLVENVMTVWRCMKNRVKKNLEQNAIIGFQASVFWFSAFANQIPPEVFIYRRWKTSCSPVNPFLLLHLSIDHSLPEAENLHSYLLCHLHSSWTGLRQRRDVGVRVTRQHYDLLRAPLAPNKRVTPNDRC